MSIDPGLSTGRQPIETRLTQAVEWWRATHPHRTTSSIIGNGAITELESWFAERVDHVAGFAVGSGTQGLIAAMLALDLGRGSVVALPAYDWSAGLSATLAIGAVPLWCDVGTNGVITADTVSRLGRTPDVVVATSLHGYPVDVRGVRGAVPEVPIIEDCSQALGALRESAPAGAHADVSVWSIGSGKLIDAGEGGVVTTQRRDLAAKLAAITQHPLRQAVSGAEVCHLTWVARMHPAAALLAAFQASHLDDRLRRARHAYDQVSGRARECGITLPEIEPSVQISPGVPIAFEPAKRSVAELLVLEPVYAQSVTSFVGHDCPPLSERWTTHGRPVVTDASLLVSRPSK